MLRILAVLTALAVPHPVLAQSPTCAPADAVTQRLQSRYGEGQIGYGIMPQQGTVMSVYVNPDTGTWTLLVIRPDGLACMAAAGEGWTPDAGPRGEGL